MPHFRATLLFTVSVVFLALHSGKVAAAENDKVATANPVVIPARLIEAQPLEAVPFDYVIDDGLYATVTSMTSFKKPSLRNERKIKLKKEVTNCKKDLEVRAIIQNEPAPLVVIFLGLTSKSKDPLARLWQSQLQEAGMNVLVFDSVFRSSFNERTNHGVAGNPYVEATVAATVVDAFIRHPEVEGKVTKIGLLGASYGGIMAINFARLAEEGKLPVKIDRVLTFSPPISMQTSSSLLDKYYEENKNHGVFDLLKMKLHDPVMDGTKIPFSPSMMRAGIGYLFHEDVKDAVDCSRVVYNYKFPDKERPSFTRFVEQIVFPYWSSKGQCATIDDLWARGELTKLLHKAPGNVQVIIARDDPLNDIQALVDLEGQVSTSTLTVLPRGGHLGYVGCNWSRNRVVNIFK